MAPDSNDPDSSGGAIHENSTSPGDDVRCDDDLDLEDESFPRAPEAIQRVSAWTNRTVVKGDFTIRFPWVGGNVCVQWPASGRQAMLEIAVACAAFLVVVPLALYIIFVGAVPENISRFGQMVRRASGGKDELRAPTKVPVKTDDGIEIIEVCPPCGPPNCDRECPCPACPIQAPCPVCPTVAAPKLAPLLGHDAGVPPRGGVPGHGAAP